MMVSSSCVDVRLKKLGFGVPPSLQTSGGVYAYEAGGDLVYVSGQGPVKVW